MHRVIAVGCLLFGVAYAADVTVGTATARAGEKAFGVVEVPAGSDAATSIPVVVINGAKPGPTIAMIAGSHGTEYASIIALQKLAQAANPAALSGAVIILPLVNVESFAHKVPHLNPVDNKNMNRFYPGKADGTQTDRALWAITKQVIDKSDYIIDLHGGDLDENLRRYSYWAHTGDDRVDRTSYGMVLAFGLDHIIIQDFRQPSQATPLTRYAALAGKPCVTAEAGHAGTTNLEDVDVLMLGCTNVLRHLKMLPGTAVPVAHPLFLGPISVVTSEHDGVFYPLVEPEAYATRGMTLGYVTDYFGKRIWDATAPVSGVIVYVGAVPSMSKGATVAYVAEIASTPEVRMDGGRE